MEDGYEEATEGFEIDSSTSRRIPALIWDAWDLEIAISGLEVFVEAQNSACSRLTGPYGVVRDVRFTKPHHNLCGIDVESLV